ncbi:MAG: RNA polymerase subunit sigma, partial [Pirellulaceae bacterium]|nr:RNA polymerase subunit sigma [Pirellulaceae bacterium]
ACRIAYYEVLRHRREKKSETVLPPSLFELLASESLERPSELDSRHDALSGCLEKLHERDRELIRRRYGEGATIRGVSQEIGRPVEGLQKAYQRIRRSLIDCVDRALAAQCREGR